MGNIFQKLKKKEVWQCQGEYCENLISIGVYCSRHKCRWDLCQGFAYNTGVDHRFCGKHECSYQHCRNRIYNEKIGICAEHICLRRKCFEPRVPQSIYCRYHTDGYVDGHSDDNGSSDSSGSFHSIDLIS